MIFYNELAIDLYRIHYQTQSDHLSPKTVKVMDRCADRPVCTRMDHIVYDI